MSESDPRGPYVYQPFGTVHGRNPLNSRRIYAVGGVRGATITGLLKAEAEAILEVMSASVRDAALAVDDMPRECALCGELCLDDGGPNLCVACRRVTSWG